MRCYFDTSALAKLVIAEIETEALRAWAAASGATIVTNIVGVVELQRAAARISATALSRATGLLLGVAQLNLTPTAVQLAARLSPAAVRTLDALHIASASEVPELNAVITYDLRMVSAARDYGLPVMSPGAE